MRAVYRSRLRPSDWAVLLEDPATVVRYHAKVYRRGPGECWYWLGAISDTGHGKLRGGTRSPGGPATRVVASHVFGYQLSRGILRSGDDGEVPLIRHRCDEASCHNPSHWMTGSVQDNALDYAERARLEGSPLTDRRGPARRAVAIRDAILAASGDVDQAIRRAIELGMPAVQGHLF
jgi:hypothetical protein